MKPVEVRLPKTALSKAVVFNTTTPAISILPPIVEVREEKLGDSAHTRKRSISYDETDSIRNELFSVSESNVDSLSHGHTHICQCNHELEIAFKRSEKRLQRIVDELEGKGKIKPARKRSQIKKIARRLRTDGSLPRVL